MTSSKSKSPLANFEKQYSELEKIVQRMESGELSLDQSLKDFERGTALCKELRDALADAEQKVHILVQQTQQTGGNTLTDDDE